MENQNQVSIKLKKSSSTGAFGYDIEVKNSDGNEELLTKLSEAAIRTALATKKRLEQE